MSNFELIDNYLTNRLGEQEKAAFEQKLDSDPALKGEVELQKNILEGVKKARVAELKAMLNNVPVGGGLSGGLAGGKIAAGIVAAGIVASSLYLYIRPTENQRTQTATASSDSQVETQPATEKPAEIVITDQTRPAVEHPIISEPQKVKPKELKKKEPSKRGSVTQPKIEVVDPSDELVDNSPKEVAGANSQKAVLRTSHIAVETDASNKKYNFHYQFSNGKLVLYGAFDKSLYEILEIHGDQHMVFLFYKENYYVLDEKQTRIAELQPIKDAALLKKLKEYRGR